MLLARLPSGKPEIFATVQGEGPTVGLPSVFVRLSECNLRCTWCDTKYTWDWQQYDKARETVELDLEAIVARVLEVSGPGTRNVVFTGGEPLLQQDELAALASTARAKGFRVEIETNGTIVPSESLAASVDQWNVSPKLSSSGNADRARQRPAALEWFAAAPNAYFKLVITAEADVTEASEMVTLLGVPAERVLLSPEGTDAATLTDRSKWLVDRCRTHGYRLGGRLHVFLWGPERGR